MPQMTLTRPEIAEMAAFCKLYNQDEFFVAKDEGVYMGVNAKTDAGIVNIIYYFDGYNPEEDGDEDWYDNATAKFGGDDFGEMLSATVFNDFLADSQAKSFVLIVTKSSIKVKFK